MSLPSIEAEYLAPTTDTGLIPLVSPDRRFTKLRTVDGHIAARLVKIPLDIDGMPVTRRAFRAHSGPPVSAYLAVGNDNNPQFPHFGYTIRDHIGIITGAAIGALALVAAIFGVWVINQ